MARRSREGDMMRKTALVAVAVVVVAALAGGVLLVRHAKPPAPSQAAAAPGRIPVVGCPARYGLEGRPPTHFPATESALLPPALDSKLAYYSDQARSVRPILGPRGWSCVVAVGADESVSIQIYPPGGSASGFQGVDARDDAPCVGCMFGDACPMIPHAAAELRYPAIPCQSALSTRETVTWVVGSRAYSRAGDDVVSVTDPPGVKGYGIPSGGPFYARGLVLFTWSPGANSNVSVINCALPTEDSMLCAAILNVFRQQNWTGH
jgi:hypothetical protein